MKKINGRPFIDMTGMKFGRWIVIERDFTKVKPSQCYWICKCECGTKKSISRSNLTKKQSTKCYECYISSMSIKMKDRINTFNAIEEDLHLILLSLQKTIEKWKKKINRTKKD